jgi:DNA-binding XRE family transcriptional regulator
MGAKKNRRIREKRNREGWTQKKMDTKLGTKKHTDMEEA